MCLYPQLLKNPKYFKNGKPRPSWYLPHDSRADYVPVGCGKCIECRNKKASEWRVRLQEELKNDPGAIFVTLTFKDEELEKFESNEANEVCARAVELFRKRWHAEYGHSLKRWLIVELGHPKKRGDHISTERVHLHGLLWTQISKKELEGRWQYGVVHIGEYVNLRTINYIVKYVTKPDKDHPDFMGKIFCSPGIGKSYAKKAEAKQNRFRGEDTVETYRLSNGQKVALPMYFRNKIYNKQEREKLWLQKLDKMERFVHGEKIDISTVEGQAEYFKAVEYRQKENKRLGYSGGDWSVQKYAKSRKYVDKSRNLQ